MRSAWHENEKHDEACKHILNICKLCENCEHFDFSKRSRQFCGDVWRLCQRSKPWVQRFQRHGHSRKCGIFAYACGQFAEDKVTPTTAEKRWKERREREEQRRIEEREREEQRRTEKNREERRTEKNREERTPRNAEVPNVTSESPGRSPPLHCSSFPQAPARRSAGLRISDTNCLSIQTLCALRNVIDTLCVKLCQCVFLISLDFCAGPCWPRSSISSTAVGVYRSQWLRCCAWWSSSSTTSSELLSVEAVERIGRKDCTTHKQDKTITYYMPLCIYEYIFIHLYLTLRNQ